MRAVLAQELHALFEETQRTRRGLLRSAGARDPAAPARLRRAAQRARRGRSRSHWRVAAARAAPRSKACVPRATELEREPGAPRAAGWRACSCVAAARRQRLCVRIDRGAPLYGESGRLRRRQGLLRMHGCDGTARPGRLGDAPVAGVAARCCSPSRCAGGAGRRISTSVAHGCSPGGAPAVPCGAARAARCGGVAPRRRADRTRRRRPSTSS